MGQGLRVASLWGGGGALESQVCETNRAGSCEQNMELLRRNWIPDAWFNRSRDTPATAPSCLPQIEATR